MMWVVPSQRVFSAYDVNAIPTKVGNFCNTSYRRFDGCNKQATPGSGLKQVHFIVNVFSNKFRIVTELTAFVLASQRSDKKKYVATGRQIKDEV